MLVGVAVAGFDGARDGGDRGFESFAQPLDQLEILRSQCELGRDGGDRPALERLERLVGVAEDGEHAMHLASRRQRRVDDTGVGELAIARVDDTPLTQGTLDCRRVDSQRSVLSVRGTPLEPFVAGLTVPIDANQDHTARRDDVAQQSQRDLETRLGPVRRIAHRRHVGRQIPDPRERIEGRRMGVGELLHLALEPLDAERVLDRHDGERDRRGPHESRLPEREPAQAEDGEGGAREEQRPRRVRAPAAGMEDRREGKEGKGDRDRRRRSQDGVIRDLGGGGAVADRLDHHARERGIDRRRPEILELGGGRADEDGASRDETRVEAPLDEVDEGDGRNRRMGAPEVDVGPAARLARGVDRALQGFGSRNSEGCAGEGGNPSPTDRARPRNLPDDTVRFDRNQHAAECGRRVREPLDRPVHDLERAAARHHLRLGEGREGDVPARRHAGGEARIVLGARGYREVDVEGDRPSAGRFEALDRRRVDPTRPGPVLEGAQAARIDRHDGGVGEARGRGGCSLGDEAEQAVVQSLIEAIGESERLCAQRQCEHGEGRQQGAARPLKRGELPHQTSRIGSRGRALEVLDAAARALRGSRAVAAIDLREEWQDACELRAGGRSSPNAPGTLAGVSRGRRGRPLRSRCSRSTRGWRPGPARALARSPGGPGRGRPASPHAA